jgi:pilus assembly protein FimV
MYRFLLDRLRRRAILVGLLALSVAAPSWGLGLGEIELQSALNQNFKAMIPLFDASSLEPDEIIVALGSTEDFQRVGVERFFFLTSLNFEVAYGPGGQPQVVVSSQRPITEPYLNFLVVVRWPAGRLLKEYTVLLDPPTFSEAPAPQVSSPVQAETTANTGRVRRVEPAQSGTRVQLDPASQRADSQRAAAERQPSPLDGGLGDREYGMTDRDDTLWSIAKQARPSREVSIHQTMLAIQRMNPDAFISGNINLLKAGYVLRLPDESEAQALSAEQAIAEVARHEEDWRAYNRGEAVVDRGPGSSAAGTDQTSDLRSPVDASPAQVTSAAPDGSGGELRIVAEDGDSTVGLGGQVSAGDLDAAMEETDRLNRQVEELSYQLDREKELTTNELAVRERQIEVRDQQIAELQAQLAAVREQAQSIQAGEGPSDDAQNQNQNTPPAESATPWWQSSAVMYGGAGILVLLLVGGMMMARRRQAAEEENDYFDAEEAFAEDERVEDTVMAFDDEDEFTETGTVVQGDDYQATQTSDVIGEADIYVAYGRFPQAIGLLTGVLDEEPDRNDVRLKLLEVYADTGERSAFDLEMVALSEHCGDEDILDAARELSSRFDDTEPVPLDELMSEEDEQPEMTSGVRGMADTDALGSEAELGAAGDLAEEPTGSQATAAPDLEFDAGLDLEADEDQHELETDQADDLGLDFETELPPSTDSATPGGDALEFETIDGFAETEELTIDAGLEEAAVSISGEAAALRSQPESPPPATADLAAESTIEAAISAESEEDLLEGLDLDNVGADAEFEFEDDGDSANTKLDLARAYIDMGDSDGARDILREVLDEGNSDQQQKAQSMLEGL